MKLSYRGVEYDYTPPAVEIQTTENRGTYRGVDIRFRTVQKAPVQQPSLDLVYRGVAYRTGTAAAPAPVPTPTPVAAAVGTIEDHARTALMRHHQQVKRRQQALLSRSATEAGLPAVDGYWTRIQGKVQPGFWATYDRSGAAAS